MCANYSSQKQRSLSEHKLVADSEEQSEEEDNSLRRDQKGHQENGTSC